MHGDDDVTSTPRDGGTAPLFHTVAEDGTVRLRRLPRGTPIHQPAREPRHLRSVRTTPTTPVVIADSSPPESTQFSSAADPPPIEPTEATPGAAIRPAEPPVVDKSTLPSRRAHISASTHAPSVMRIVILSATIGALFASIVFIAGYFFLLQHGG